MPSNWPSAIQQSSSSRSSGVATELSEETEFSTAAVVREETKSLVSKVQTLQNAYDEYLDAEQVSTKKVDFISIRTWQVHCATSMLK